MVLTTYSGFDAEVFLRDVLGAKNISVSGNEIRHKCLLPFGLHKHGDTTGKASLNVEKLVYNCWVCGGGTLLWAIQEILQVSSGEARRILEENAVVTTQSAAQFREELEKRWTGGVNEPPALPTYSEAMLKPWLCYATYLDERGVSHEVQKKMKTGVNTKNLDKVGDEWITQPRLIIPHFFERKLRGWTARKIDVRQVGTKYRHTPNFPKDYSLYNIDDAPRNEIIVVESPMSVLKLMSEGYNNAVATFGAQVTDRQIDLLKEFERIIWFPDGDKAGYTALVDKIDKKNRKEGLISKLMGSDLWIIDHGIHEIGGSLRYNEKDAANYSAPQIEQLLEEMIPSFMFDWRYDELQKVDNG